VPPIPKTEAIIAWREGVGISFLDLCARALFPSPPGEGQGEGEIPVSAERIPLIRPAATFSQGRRKGVHSGDKLRK
jgi:hypothetical protein